MDEPSKEPQRPPLPPDVIDRLWNRMHGIFGAQWTDKWRTGEPVTRGTVTVDKGVIIAKGVWAMGLAGYADRLDRLWRATDMCQSRQFPPNLPEFRELCQQQSDRFQPRLTAPHPGADVRQRNVAAALAALAGKMSGGAAQ